MRFIKSGRVHIQSMAGDQTREQAEGAQDRVEQYRSLAGGQAGGVAKRGLEIVVQTWKCRSC